MGGMQFTPTFDVILSYMSHRQGCPSLDVVDSGGQLASNCTCGLINAKAALETVRRRYTEHGENTKTLTQLAQFLTSISTDGQTVTNDQVYNIVTSSLKPRE